VKCTQELLKHFDDKTFDISKELDYEIVFYVFPIENVQSLRKKVSSFRRNS